VNLLAHIQNGRLNIPMLEETVRTAMRMLDNENDINY
jgi:ribonucleoside-diphosphate reductase alpha chain